MGSSKYFVRKTLPHQAPAWVGDGEIFFITICAKNRETQPLTQKGVPEQLLEAAIQYHETGRWWTRLFLIMPDHVHALVAVPGNEVMRKVVAQWKTITAKITGVEWQKDFFDHRPRDLRALEEKEIYIFENPVRKGLVKTPEEWKWVVKASRHQENAGEQPIG